MIGQINIGERPTWPLSIKYLANSKRVRDATTVEYDLELITIRDFLHSVVFNGIIHHLSEKLDNKCRKQNWRKGCKSEL